MSETVNIPKGGHTVNPLIATDNTRELIEFLKVVFSAVEDKNALAYSEDDGKIFNSSITIGDTSIIIFDRKEGWKHTPSFLQVYVDDIDAKLKLAVLHGARIVTKPTPFYGGRLARFIDAQGNLWWLFELSEYNADDWQSSDENEEIDEDTTWSLEVDSNMTYIHNSLVTAMKELNRFK